MEAFSSLRAQCGDIDADIRDIIERRAYGSSARMYKMLEYFLGFKDQEFNKSAGDGKRLRPVLCLGIAEGYGARERALPAALSIELFHNFTLIHDDIADRDEMRRNKPTLWKLYGIDHALNAGDAQLLFACELASKTGERALTDVLLEAFFQVVEGQYMDFETARYAPEEEINEEFLLESARKKTGALMRASAEAAGIAAGRVEEELMLLREYGESLGVVFQLADDYASIWQTSEETGKDMHSDIREHKRTLPFLLATKTLNDTGRSRLVAIYACNRQLSDEEIREAKDLIDGSQSRELMKKRIDSISAKAKNAAGSLSVDTTLRETLVTLVDELSIKG